MQIQCCNIVADVYTSMYKRFHGGIVGKLCDLNTKVGTVRCTAMDFSDLSGTLKLVRGSSEI